MRSILRKGLVWPAALAALAAVVLASSPGARMSVLRAAGWALVAGDPAEPADEVVVAADAGAAGALEASDLVRQGLASRVSVFEDPPGPVDREFLRRGIPYVDEAAVTMRQLKDLGVGSVERIPRAVAGTEDEGEALRAWCDQNRFRTVIFVSMRDHSRRTRRILARAMKGHPTRILVRYSRYSPFDPDAWWLSREGIRIEIVESEKLVLDMLRHPIPA